MGTLDAREQETLPRQDLYVVDPWGSDAASNLETKRCIVKHPSCLSLCQAAAQPAMALSRLCLVVAVDGSSCLFQLCARYAVIVAQVFEVATASACELSSSFARAAL